MWIDKYLIYVSVLCLILLFNVVEAQVSACTNTDRTQKNDGASCACGSATCSTATLIAGNNYCSNRICSGSTCTESVKKATLAECASAVISNVNCGNEFSYASDDGWCDCVPPGQSCVPASFGNYATYKIDMYCDASSSSCFAAAAATPSCTNTDGTLLNSAECGCGSIEKCGCSHGTTTVSMNLDTIKLVNRGSTPSYPLTKCQGDCDSDSHCADGLKCFQRSNGEAIPGCHGTSSDMPSTYDVCTEFISDTTYNRYSPWEPLLQTVLTSDVSVLSTTINWTDQGSGYQRGYL